MQLSGVFVDTDSCFLTDLFSAEGRVGNLLFKVNPCLSHTWGVATRPRKFSVDCHWA